MADAVLEAAHVDGRRLVVRFTKAGDFYRHHICWVQDAGEEVLLESYEGDQHDPSPSSPALQELVTHETPEGKQVLLLTGSAGQAHWSVSVEAQSQLQWSGEQMSTAFPPNFSKLLEGRTFHSAAITFEIAVRAKSSEQPILSTYASPQPIPPWKPLATYPMTMLVGRCALSAESAEVRIDKAQQNRVIIRPNLNTASGPSTITYSYSIALTPTERD